MSYNTLQERVEALAQELTARGWTMVTAESCTGGLIAAACTEISGSSNWFERGMVTYSNEAKTDLLGVPSALIDEQGAVSEAVARAMASGALAHSKAQVALSVTGVAGPTGGSADKPVGTVWFGWATPGGVFAQRHWFDGDRTTVRMGAVALALDGLLNRLVTHDDELPALSSGNTGTLNWVSQRDHLK